eukprot:2023248-Alexandrium_andersonii.AAC.1
MRLDRLRLSPLPLPTLFISTPVRALSPGTRLRTSCLTAATARSLASPPIWRTQALTYWAWFLRAHPALPGQLVP